MIFVDRSEFQPTKKWLKKAERALSQIESLPEGQRAKAIDKKRRIWCDIKPYLSELSHGKCWYCESRTQLGVSAVDHFRPKNGDEARVGHKGYWWLAFDWKNYRFSCAYCNSRMTEETEGGKWDHFPLLNPAERASENNRAADERPCLLDPLDPSDPDLLWFNEEGMPEPRYTEQEDVDMHRRADETWKLYHLHNGGLVEQRKDTILRVNNLVDDIDLFLALASRYNDLEAKARAVKRMAELAGMLKDSAPFAATARIALYDYLGSIGHVRQLLSPYMSHFQKIPARLTDSSLQVALSVTSS